MISIKNKRYMKILEMLINNKNIKSEELSNFIGVSSRTISTDIKGLNDILNENGAFINSIKGVGYALEIKDKKKFSKINVDRKNKKETSLYDVDFSIPDNRVDFIKRELLFNALKNKAITQQDLADKMFISLSTLKNSLKEVEKMLSKYNLKIVSYKTKGIIVYGDELQIRYCISQYLSEHVKHENYEFYQKVFEKIDLKSIKNIILDNISKYDVKLTDNALSNIVVHIAIAISRASNNNLLGYTLDEMEYIEELVEYKIASGIFTDLKTNLNIDMVETELYYIAKHLLASKRYLNNSNNKVLKHETKLIEEITNKIKEILDIDFSKDLQLIEGLIIHLEIAINRMKFGMNIRNEVLSVIKNNYPLAFQVAIIASRVIEEREDVRLNEAEIGFIALHFGAALSRKGIDTNVKFKTAIIVCSSGLGTSNLVKAKLHEHFNDRIRVVNTMSGYELTEEILNSVDMVLSTIEFKHLNSNKIINIENLLDSKEVMKLKNFINGVEEKEFKYEDFFRKDCFYSGYAFKNKEEVIDFLAKDMIRKSLIDEKAKASILEREELSSTEIGNLVAVPHPIDNDTEISATSIMILDKPIMWDEQYVQVIFLISISKDKIKLWQEVFMKLFNYLIKEAGAKEIIRNKDYTKFINSFIS